MRTRATTRTTTTTGLNQEVQAETIHQVTLTAHHATVVTVALIIDQES